MVLAICRSFRNDNRPWLRDRGFKVPLLTNCLIMPCTHAIYKHCWTFFDTLETDFTKCLIETTLVNSTFDFTKQDISAPFFSYETLGCGARPVGHWVWLCETCDELLA